MRLADATFDVDAFEAVLADAIAGDIVSDSGASDELDTALQDVAVARGTSDQASAVEHAREIFARDHG